MASRSSRLTGVIVQFAEMAAEHVARGRKPIEGGLALVLELRRLFAKCCEVIRGLVPECGEFLARARDRLRASRPVRPPTTLRASASAFRSAATAHSHVLEFDEVTLQRRSFSPYSAASRSRFVSRSWICR